MTFSDPFPAHAGMNRRFAMIYSEFWSVPRTRGDEPQDCARTAKRCARSPHTRG